MPPEEATDNYVLTQFANAVAEQTSGVKGALPEQDDFDLAREVMEFTERKIKARGFKST